jgi:hypothetical protein
LARSNKTVVVVVVGVGVVGVVGAGVHLYLALIEHLGLKALALVKGRRVWG